MGDPQIVFYIELRAIDIGLRLGPFRGLSLVDTEIFCSPLFAETGQDRLARGSEEGWDFHGDEFKGSPPICAFLKTSPLPGYVHPGDHWYLQKWDTVKFNVGIEYGAIIKPFNEKPSRRPRTKK